MTRRITGLSSMATRQILADLAQVYEQRTGCEVAIQSMGGVAAAQRIRDGERTDIVILAADVVKALEAEGHVIAGSYVDLARSSLAFAVRAGALRQDLRDTESVKRAMLEAGRVAYSTGPSGDHLKALWAHWGIAETMAERAVQAPPGVPVGTLIAQGNADLGVQQLSELLRIEGIDIIETLPADVQSTTVFSAGICTTASSHDNARAFIDFLASPEADATKRRYGMEPA